MKRTMLHALCLALSLGLALTSFAKTIYVRCGLSDYTDHDGTSWEKAYETIQQGIGAASVHGDTILVHAGVYDKGWGRGTPAAGVTYHWWGKARINFSASKSVTIRSCKSVDEEDVLDPAHTFIMGADDPTGTNGFGEDAVRCVQFEGPPGNTTTNVLQGFTLKGGRTKDSTSAPGYGGAVQVSQNGNDQGPSGLWIVDSIITDCQAGNDHIALGGNFVRCKIIDTDFTFRPGIADPSASSVTVCNQANFYNCLFSNLNMVHPTTYETIYNSCYIGTPAKCVNCSFVNNRALFWHTAPAYQYNVLVSASRLPTSDGAWPVNNGKTLNRYTDSAANASLIAPTLGDYRLRTESVATTAGDPAHLADSFMVTNVPASVDMYVDLDGNAIPKTGTICAGCCQTTVTPAAGKLYATNARVYFDNSTNCCTASDTSNYAYVWPMAYPTNYRVRAVACLSGKGENQGLINFQVGGARTAPSWKHDDIYLAPPTSGSREVTVNVTGRIAYAKPGADEATADGSYEHPYPTLQQAYDKYAGNAQIIRAFPGEYKTGGSTWTRSDQTCNVRLNISASTSNQRIVAMEGPEKTAIVGAPDPDEADGCGTNATMLVAVSANAHICGFTLTGGYSLPAAGLNADGTRPIFSYSTDLSFTDCIITNNHGGNFGVGIARFERCLIADNHGRDGIVGSAIMSACIMRDNHLSASDACHICDFAGDYWRNRCFQCTIVGDGQHSLWRHNCDTSVRINTIGDRGGSYCSGKGTNRGNVYNGFASYDATDGNLVADPMLAADCRLVTSSPAKTASVSPATDSSDLWAYAQTDFYGNPLRYDASGKVYCGAVQDTVTGGVYLGRGNGGIATSGADFGFTSTNDFVVATVSMAAGATRPLAGVVVNGVTNRFDETTAAYTVTKADVVQHGDIAVVPFYGNEWYVDAANGSDTANWGYNAGNAFKTLARALTNGCLISGDHVVALPGEYKENTISNATTIVPARAYVKNGITLESRDGAATTFIVGKASTTPAFYTNMSFTVEQRAGLGPEAVRGVFIENGGIVKGFTISGGYTYGFAADGTTMHGGFRCNGGGVASDGAGRIENCIINGCKAFRGGGMFRTVAIRCIFDGNYGLYGGGASSDAYQYGCLARNNVCYGNSGVNSFFWWGAVENCTILDSIGGPWSSGGVLKNTFVWGDVGNCDYQTSFTGSNYKNCIFADRATGYVRTAIYHDKILAGVGCQIVSLDQLQVDDDGRPVIGSNAAIDAGDIDLFDSKLPTDYDLSGVQRVYNGAVDVGALEADWRGTYATALGKRATVTEASSSVTMAAATDKMVTMHNGGRMTVDLEKSVKSGEFKVNMAGIGTLSVYLNGELLQQITSSTTCHFKSMLPTDHLEFVYSSSMADASASIYSIRSKAGQTVIFW